jgi:hypothetical protein
MSNFASIVEKHLSYAADNMLLAANSDGSQDGWISPGDILAASNFLTQSEIEALPGFGGGVNISLAYFFDAKTSGTNGGTFTAGAWRTRDVSGVECQDGWLTTDSNQLIIDAGDYLALIFCPCHYVGQSRARLYNIDTSTELLSGNSYAYSWSVDIVVAGFFNISTDNTALEIQHQCATTNTSLGFGVASGMGTEVYTRGILCQI